MGYALKSRYERPEKRQALREQEEISAQWNRVCMEFENLLFGEDFKQELFQIFNDQWIKWANNFNKKKVISWANPRAFHDEYINQNLYE